MKKTNPTQLIITFDERCKQVITPSEHFFKDIKGKPYFPSWKDWKELATHLIGNKEYIKYETV